MRKTILGASCVVAVLLGMTAFCGCRPGWAVLPGGYHVHRNSGDEVFVAPLSWNVNTPIIPSKTIGLWWSGDWIVGKCHPLVRRSQNPRDTTMIADALRMEYWIINLAKEASHGPYKDQSAFEQAVIDFKVSSGSISFQSPPFTRMEE